MDGDGRAENLTLSIKQQQSDRAFTSPITCSTSTYISSAFWCVVHSNMLPSVSLVRLASRRINPGAAAASVMILPETPAPQSQTRSFASSGRNNSSKKKRSFQPRRRPHKQYRPFVAPKYDPGKLVDKDLKVEVGNVPDGRNDIERTYGHYTADLIQRMQRDQHLRQQGYDKFKYEEEEMMKAADYMTAEPGSTEALIFERKALEHLDDDAKEDFYKRLEDFEKEGFQKSVLDDIEDDNLLPLKPPKPKKGAAFEELFQTDEEVCTHKTRIIRRLAPKDIPGKIVLTVSLFLFFVVRRFLRRRSPEPPRNQLRTQP